MERLELLLKARNILHKQENGQKLSGNEIIIAHDYVDMVIDDMISRPLKIFTVTYMYGQKVYAANSRQELYNYLNTREDDWLSEPVSLDDIEEVIIDSSKEVQFLGGHVE